MRRFLPALAFTALAAVVIASWVAAAVTTLVGGIQ